MSSVISALENKIRDRINSGRKQHELLGRTSDWNRLCSALDVIGDTELALDSYLNHPQVEDIGVRYLHVYGALQLLQTQQDAAAEICAALQIKPAASPKVPLVRELRSSSIGHPTRQKENNVSKSNFIVRVTLSQHGFTLFTVTAGESQHTERRVSVPKLIDLQRIALQETLREVISTMDGAEMKHRDLHKDNKLVACFPDTLEYYFSKIFEAIHSSRIYPLGQMHVDLVAECLARMKWMLEERGEWGVFDSINYEYELLEYPLEKLAAFFSDRSPTSLNDRDAFIFCSFARERIKVLQEIAKEIDGRYAASPEDDA
jgi:hypothetical protein